MTGQVTPVTPPSARASAAVLALALAGFVARAVDTAAIYNHTFDEPTQIASGLELLQYGKFELHLDVPPLAKVMLAAPLYATGLRLSAPPRHAQYAFANEVLYDHPYWKTLRSARAVNTLIGVILLLALYAMGLRLFGSAGAAVTVLVASLSPGLVSAASIANSDMLGVLTVLAALWVWRRVLEAPSVPRATLFGLIFALAIATKLSALPFLAFSLPVVTIFTLGFSVLVPLRQPLRWTRAHWLQVLAGAAIVPFALWATYGFHLAPPTGADQAAKMAASLAPRFPALASYVAGLSTAQLPLGGFFRGLAVASNISRMGHPAYLMGNFSLHGWPQYFLITLGLKVPLGILVAVALALAVALQHRRSAAGRDVLLVLTVAAAIVASVMKAGINAGHRHIIVVEALFALAIGGAACLALANRGSVASRAWIGVLALSVGTGAIASVKAHPDALGYTNLLAGSQPDWWFVDSNLDWGQDLVRLGRFLDEHGVGEPVHLAYFGTALPARHGVRSVPLLPGDRPAGWVAVSVHYERGLFGSAVGLLPTEVDQKAYSWLLQFPPAALIGTSIRVYHLSPADLAGLAITK